MESVTYTSTEDEARQRSTPRRVLVTDSVNVASTGGKTNLDSGAADIGSINVEEGEGGANFDSGTAVISSTCAPQEGGDGEMDMVDAGRFKNPIKAIRKAISPRGPSNIVDRSLPTKKTREPASKLTEETPSTVNEKMPTIVTRSCPLRRDFIAIYSVPEGRIDVYTIFIQIEAHVVIDTYPL